MTLRPFGLLTAIATTVTLLNTIDSAEAAAFYSVSGLPFIPSDLNDRGQVVGQNYLWSDGNLTDLRTLPGAENSPLVARAINDWGVVVGEGFKSDATQIYSQAFRSDGKTVTDLGIVGSSICSSFCVKTIATAINNSGQIGFNLEYQSYDGSVSGYLQQPQGERQNVFPGYRLISLNDDGNAIGHTIGRGRSGPSRGVISDGTTTHYLDAPGYCFSISSGCFSEATFLSGINNQGQVVGFGPARPARETPMSALLWNDSSKNAIALTLPGLGGSGRSFYGKTTSLANSINNAEQIVGFSYMPDGDQRAVLWQGDRLIDLNQQINNSDWKLSAAQKINNQGQIVGVGYRNSQQQGFLLTPIDDVEPVPEPDSSLAVWIGAGTIGLMAFHKTRKRRRNY